MKFLQNIPPYLFLPERAVWAKPPFPARRLSAAGRGKRVLLVSTDPASNVGGL